MLADGSACETRCVPGDFISCCVKGARTMAAQSYKNHTRFDPKFHFFLIPLCLICFVASIFHVVHQPTPPNVLLVPVTFALLLLAFTARMYAIQNQNRIIRLEESTRLRSLGGDPNAVTMQQFIALRFASDAELPSLTARAVAERMEPRQIKEAVVSWRPDLDRV